MKHFQEKRDLGAHGTRPAPKRNAADPKSKGPSRKNDALIREIHHRTINQLNLIYNILYFQKQFSHEGCCSALLQSIQKRIKAIAVVYEHLDRSQGFNRVRFAGYCKGLLGEMLGAANGAKRKISLKTRIAAVSLDVSTAVHCGLIISELLDNALKHAFADDRPAEIFFGVQARKDGTLVITVSDNGVGLPPEVQWRRSGSMGSFLINTLSDNLKGEVTVDVSNGTSFQLRFHPSRATGHDGGVRSPG